LRLLETIIAGLSHCSYRTLSPYVLVLSVVSGKIYDLSIVTGSNSCFWRTEKKKEEETGHLWKDLWWKYEFK